MLEIKSFEPGVILAHNTLKKLESPNWIEARLTTLRSYLTSTYPQYKHLIPENPTDDQFELAWEYIFGAKFSDCAVNIEADKYNLGFKVRTPDGTTAHHGGFGFHTEMPKLKKKSFYYEMGPNWDTDDNGVRYYKIDRATMLPVDFDEVIATEIIQRYILNNSNRKKVSGILFNSKLIN